MNKMLKDYLAIFDEFPKTTYLTKTQRKARHQALLNFDKTTYHEAVGMDELMAFIALHHHLIMIDNPIFFKKKSFPPYIKTYKQMACLPYSF